MKRSELKKHLKAMSDAQKDELLYALYDRFSKPEREMMGLIADAIEKGKEPPTPRQVIAPVKQYEKSLAALSEKLHTWRGFRTRASRAKLKKELREMLKTLPLMPAQAASYPDALRLYRNLMRFVSLADTGVYEYGDIYSVAGMDARGIFAGYLQLATAGGVKVSVLEDLLSWAIKPSARNAKELLARVELVAAQIKNGDMIQELMDRLEPEMENPVGMKEDYPRFVRQWRYTFAWLVLADKLEGISAAGEQLLSRFPGEPTLEAIAAMKIGMEMESWSPQKIESDGIYILEIPDFEEQEAD